MGTLFLHRHTNAAEVSDKVCANVKQKKLRPQGAFDSSVASLYHYEQSNEKAPVTKSEVTLRARENGA